MIKYLDLFEKDMKKHNADYFVEQIQLYKNMYTHYKNTSCPSPIYTGILNHGDTHCFYFPTNENVNLTWDVNLIYKKFLKFNTTRYISLKDFEKIFSSDLKESQEEIKRIYNSVKNIFPHTYNNILTIFFKPMHKNLILDGRHRYIEFKKFKKNQLINFSYLNSEDIMDCIPTAFDLVKYIILNNLSEMKFFYDQKKNIETMNFEFYGLSLF